MKRDARIGLAVVLVVGLAITLLVARSIHQSGAQAGIDQDPVPERETASLNQAPDSGATIDPAYDVQARAVMEFQTQHDYAPAPVSQVSDTNPAGVPVEAGSGTDMASVRNRMPNAADSRVSTAPGMLPPVGQPPVPLQQLQQKPALNSLGSYTIAAGDNPWKIAAKVFGDGKYAQKIVEANPDLNPGKMRVGQKIDIPAIPNATPRIALENTATSAGGSPQPLGGPGPAANLSSGNTPIATIGAAPTATSQTHIVAMGDTLGKIAAKYLGSSGPKAVKKLQDANPGLDVHRLKIGQELKIPTP